MTKGHGFTGTFPAQKMSCLQFYFSNNDKSMQMQLQFLDRVHNRTQSGFPGIYNKVL